MRLEAGEDCQVDLEIPAGTKKARVEFEWTCGGCGTQKKKWVTVYPELGQQMFAISCQDCDPWYKRLWGFIIECLP